MDCLSRHTSRSSHALRVAFAFVATFSIATIVSITSVAAAPAPVVDAASQGPTISDLKNRVKRIETRLENQGLVDLMRRFDQLQSDMQRIIGDLEVQSHQLRTMKKQQKDIYTDIDRRLRKLEQAPASSSGVPVSPAPAFTSPGGSGGTSSTIATTPVPVMPAGGGSQMPQTSTGTSANIAPQQAPQKTRSMSDVEQNVARSAYERAFNLLKQRRYKLAITSFKAFLETYPNASYADNAQYWLGEANYANREYKTALSEFQKVISAYPNSPKRADAMLKIGYTHAELGNKKKALNTLNTIVSSYPGSTAARLAQKRIKTLSGKR